MPPRVFVVVVIINIIPDASHFGFFYFTPLYRLYRFDYQEGVNILQIFRLLSNEEQRIAYAVLEGMRLQKDLDSQNQSKAAINA